jgi:uncharacterized protein YggT (Ycf19 family)
MTYDTRDDTVVRERVVEERPVAAYGPPQTSSNVNVAPGSSGPTYVTDTGPGPLYWARRIVSLLFGILFVLIALRILLLLLVANQSNAIVDFIYGVTEPFVVPFRGVFAIDTVSPGGGSALDVGALVALIGWFLIYLLIIAILNLGDRRPTAA